MAVSFLVNRAKETNSTTGTDPFVVTGAVSDAFQTFEEAGVTNGVTVSYVATTANGAEWEVGRGVYTTADNTLTRPDVHDNSNGDTSPVNFTTAPAVAIDAIATDFTDLQDTDNHVDGTTNKVYTATEKTKLAGIETAATADQSAAEILTAIKTVDGTGTGLDADLLDGAEASSFVSNSLLTTRGDIIRRGASAPERVALGTGGYALKSDGTDAVWAASREVLTANRTYYVDGTLGSDSNDGLSSGAGAFATLQVANDVVAALDIGAYTVTISVADDTYTAGVTISGPYEVTTGSVVWDGNTTTPANCVISVTSAYCFYLENRAVATIKGFKVTTTTNFSCIHCTGQSIAIIDGAMEYGAVQLYHLVAANGSQIDVRASYTISGGGYAHFFSARFGNIVVNTGSLTITTSGSPAWSVGFAYCIDGGLVLVNNSNTTFSGSGGTGKYYSITSNGLVETYGAAPTWFPGGSSGTTSTQGQYL